jgi:hypothetical protein
MNTSRSSLHRFILIVALLVLAAPLRAETDKVKFVRVPDGGIQPQAMADAKGVVHLIYLKGDPKACDVFYVRQEPGAEGFSKPIQVNSQAGSAIAVGTIRGAQLALGRNGRVHVAWNGSKSMEGAKHRGVPMWYARLNAAGHAFEPQRDVITFTGGLDGGGTVAADDQGNVYVMWHGFAPDKPANELGRAVYLARSTDDGKSFAPEKEASPKATGACGCCGMRAFADRAGNVFALYRAATAMVNRDEVLLVSRDRGGSFAMANAHPWNVPTCPMSSASLSETKAGTLAAWETAGQVYFATANAKSLKVSEPVSPPGTAKRKHPSVVANAKGEVLMAWAEGTGWQKGGAVAWQVFDVNGKPTEENGRLANGVPSWSLVAAVAQGDGSFVIFH